VVLEMSANSGPTLGVPSRTAGWNGDAAKLLNTIRVEARVPGLRRRPILAMNLH
jgi:hypothetical protein